MFLDDGQRGGKLRRTCGLLAFFALLIHVAGEASLRADEPPRPQAGERDAGDATVELRVEFVKHARRRGLTFLFESANFRSGEHTPIAIRDADLTQFGVKNPDELAARFQGKRVRATGGLIVDEDQTLLVIERPAQLQLIKDAPAEATASRLTVVNERGELLELPTPLPADMPREQVTIEHEGMTERYEGVPLFQALWRAKTTLGADARGEALAACYVVVRAADGYRAVLALGEVDPHLTDNRVLLAERRDGEALSDAEGALLLVVPQDKRQRRWVKSVVRIEVHSAGGEESSIEPDATR